MIVWFWMNFLSFPTQNIRTPAETSGCFIQGLLYLFCQLFTCFLFICANDTEQLRFDILTLFFFFLWVTAVVLFILPQAELSLHLILLSFGDHT